MQSKKQKHPSSPLVALFVTAIVVAGCGGGGGLGGIIDQADLKWDLGVEFDAGGDIDILDLLGVGSSGGKGGGKKGGGKKGGK